MQKESSRSREFHGLGARAYPVSVLRQFGREQIGFDGEIIGALHVSFLRCRIGLIHVALDLIHGVLFARGEWAARDFLQIRVAARQ